MRAVTYSRVSTEEQFRTGFSLAAQAERMKAYCELYSLEIIEAVEDGGYSAKNLKRPGIQKILEMVKARTIDTIVVVKLDRLTRSVRDLADLIDTLNKSGVALVSVNENLDTRSASGRLVMNLIGTVSQWEREACGERVHAVVESKRAQGLSYCGRSAPHGYTRVDGRLVPVESERRAIEAVMSLSGKMSLSAIGRELARRGYMNREGRPFVAKSIAKIISSARNREIIDNALNASIAVAA